MNTKITIHCATLLLAATVWLNAGETPAPKPGSKEFERLKTLVGTWKGTSLCQIKSSPCHDEIAVYHISYVNDSTYHIILNKVVDGKEEDMGVDDFKYDPKKHSLYTVHQGIWEFIFTGETMKGTLLYKKQVYRIINLKRTK